MLEGEREVAGHDARVFVSSNELLGRIRSLPDRPPKSIEMDTLDTTGGRNRRRSELVGHVEDWADVLYSRPGRENSSAHLV